MALKSAKQDSAPRIIEQQVQTEEVVLEGSLRPKNLDEYIGQSALKKHMKVAISSAKIRKQPLEHILLYGPPGLGKTTLSLILAHEMWGILKSSSGPAIEKPSDIVSLLTSLQEWDILFIDEIHRLKPVIEEILYGAMEDFAIDIMLGTGPGATSVKMNLPRFTLIGATTKLSHISSPLRDRFGHVLKLDFYAASELATIVLRTGQLLECSISGDLAQAIARRSRGTPRIANRLTKIIRDYLTIGERISSEKDADRIFLHLGIDEHGLDNLDRRLIQEIQGSFAGGPVSLATLASIIGEEESTLEDVIEPYLLKIGFLERTPRGRKVTQNAQVYLSTLS